MWGLFAFYVSLGPDPKPCTPDAVIQGGTVKLLKSTCDGSSLRPADARGSEAERLWV